MTIESIKASKAGGVFAMLIFAGRANEMFFETEAEAHSYVAAFNAITA